MQFLQQYLSNPYAQLDLLLISFGLMLVRSIDHTSSHIYLDVRPPPILQKSYDPQTLMQEAARRSQTIPLAIISVDSSHNQGYAISFLHNIQYYLRVNEIPFKGGVGGDHSGDKI